MLARNIVLGLVTFFLWLPMQGIAQDCGELLSDSWRINANDYRGEIRDFSITSQGGGIYRFTANAYFNNEPTDPIVGQCKDKGVVNFVRTRTGDFTQHYSGRVVGEAGKGGGWLIKGSFSHDHQTGFKWEARVFSGMSE